MELFQDAFGSFAGPSDMFGLASKVTKRTFMGVMGAAQQQQLQQSFSR